MLANCVFFAAVTFLYQNSRLFRIPTWVKLPFFFGLGFYVGVLCAFATRTLGRAAALFLSFHKREGGIYSCIFCFPSSQWNLHGGVCVSSHPPTNANRPCRYPLFQMYPSAMQKLFIFIRVEIFPPQNCFLHFALRESEVAVREWACGERGKQTAAAWKGELLLQFCLNPGGIKKEAAIIKLEAFPPYRASGYSRSYRQPRRRMVHNESSV